LPQKPQTTPAHKQKLVKKENLNMKKYWPIIKDALILLVVSSVFVKVCDYFFRGLKKTAGTDPVVTAIIQDNTEGVTDSFSEKEFQNKNLGAATYADFAKTRANVRDDQQRTPLMWAAYANLSDTERLAKIDEARAGMVDLLVQKEANINAQDEHGWTPLMWASWSGLTKTAQRLIDLGANVAIADARGNTALMMAAQRGNTAILRSLIARGASPLALTAEGKTAKDLAQTALHQYPERQETYQQIINLL
jgi:ankyrin repeat protein